MKERLASLDVFRGITISGMILVNNPGSWSHVYQPLLHAKWHGWTPTDLIFPFFLFIVGVSMTFSLEKQLASHSRNYIYKKIAKRTFILFGLGLFLSGFPHYDFTTIRIPGVLQRIAVVYCIASLITMNTGIKVQAWTMASLLLLYWGLMTLIPVGGYDGGDLSVEGNFAAFMDNKILHGHLWKKTWDPEGLMSTIPAIATTLSGVLTGHWLRSGKDKREIAGWIFVCGWIAILAGLLWNIVFPINKNIWTSSYVLFTSGAALQFLGFCYWLIDVKGIKKWAQFGVIYGMNAITVFVLSGLAARLLLLVKIQAAEGKTISLKSWIYGNFFSSWADPLNASLAFAIVNVLFWLGMMAILYKRNIFIKI